MLPERSTILSPTWKGDTHTDSFALKQRALAFILVQLLIMFTFASSLESNQTVVVSVGILLSGDCGALQTSGTINDTISATLRHVASPVELNYTLFSACDTQMEDMLQILNSLYSTEVFHSIIMIPQPQDCILGMMYVKNYNKFTITPNCPRNTWTHPQQYNDSNVISLQSSSNVLSNALDLLLRHFQWGKLYFIVSVNSYWIERAQAVSIYLSALGYRVHFIQLCLNATSSYLQLTTRELLPENKVAVLFMDADRVSQIKNTYKEMRSDGTHVFVAVAPSVYELPSFLEILENKTSDASGLFVLSPEYKSDDLNINANSSDFEGNKSAALDFSTNNDVYQLTAHLYDALTVLLYAVTRTLDKRMGVQRPRDLVKNIVGTSLSTPFRDLYFDTSGDMLTGYVVFGYSPSSGIFERVISLERTDREEMSISVIKSFEWSSEVPTGDKCFLQDWTCWVEEPAIDALTVLYIFLGVIGATCVTVGIVYLVRRYFARKEMEKGPNKLLLASGDVVFIHRKHMNRSSKTLAKSTMFEKPDILKASEPSYSMTSLNDYVDFSDTARYNGDLVHVKEIQVKGFEIKAKLMSFLRMLRDLRHENLNTFVGFLHESTRPAIITEFCNRGSLEDVIQNDDIKLDWDFKLSLLTDLVRGIRYIQASHLKYHGFLKSRNCVVDSRWVLKITDYGMPGILATAKLSRSLEPRDLLWTAPELLRDPVLLQKGSEKGDVFSLSIIMQEIILRTSPYSTTGLTPEEIIQKVRKPPPLIRPSVSQQAAPPQYIQLMKQCWAEMPDMRPDVENIYHQFKTFNHGKKMNIVDTMFKMLEKYSSDLEEIVHNRTMQLEEEKKKTDQLLFRMLPASVAESLKLGRQVAPETFDEATIYFSDIVGFTTISAMSSPLQVVDLLNDLYTMFDATIDLYDVYKVETIGDAYMVSSGLPVRNGNRHAGEIGTMALDLLSQCGTFTIRHMPEVPLRLRIGLHTGHCVAGVVGLTMPRYCLFGDTVNTASRMESSGGAFRIHVSQQTKEKLDELKGYKTQFRGEVELKGKGMAKTYWLVGKEGFDKPLPEPPEMGEDNHGLASVVAVGEEFKGQDGSKAKKPNSKSSLADLVGAINTLRKVALNKSPKPTQKVTSHPLQQPKQSKAGGSKVSDVPDPIKQFSNGNAGKTTPTRSGSPSRPSTEGQVSLTPITLQIGDRESSPSPPIELTRLNEQL